MTGFPTSPMPVDDFVTWANGAYHLDLPLRAAIAPGSLLHELWGQQVDASQNPTPGVLARAKATAQITVFAKVAGTLLLEIRPLNRRPRALRRRSRRRIRRRARAA